MTLTGHRLTQGSCWFRTLHKRRPKPTGQLPSCPFHEHCRRRMVIATTPRVMGPLYSYYIMGGMTNQSPCQPKCIIEHPTGCSQDREIAPTVLKIAQTSGFGAVFKGTGKPPPAVASCCLPFGNWSSAALTGSTLVSWWAQRRPDLTEDHSPLSQAAFVMCQPARTKGT